MQKEDIIHTNIINVNITLYNNMCMLMTDNHRGSQLHVPTCICSEVPHDLCPLSVCSISLPHSLHLNPVSGVRLEGGQSVGGVTVGRLGDIDGAILGGVGHSEGVALGVAG